MSSPLLSRLRLLPNLFTIGSSTSIRPKEKVTNPFLLHQYVRPRGTVVCIGLPANAYLRAPVFDSVIKMVNIKGSYVGNRKDTAEALDFYRRGMIKAPFKTVPLKELPKVYELMEKGQIAGRYVLDMSDA